MNSSSFQEIKYFKKGLTGSKNIFHTSIIKRKWETERGEISSTACIEAVGKYGTKSQTRAC